MTPAHSRNAPAYNEAPVSAAEFRDRQARMMKEAELQAGIIAMAERLGWLVYHTYDSRKSEAGYPDLHLVHAATGRSMFRELKTMKGRVTPDQRKWLAALTAAGDDAGVWRPDDFVNDRIRAELTPPARTPATARPASTLPDLAGITLAAIPTQVLERASAIDLAKGADCIMFAARIRHHGGIPDKNRPIDWPPTLGPWPTIHNPPAGYALAVAYLAAATQKETNA